MPLTETQVERYSRQIILPEIGGRGQTLLLRSSLWLAGAAEPLAGAARYLAGAGVGRIAVGDGDPLLTAELVALNPDARVERNGTAAGADVALAGAAADATSCQNGPLWIRGGVAGGRAWVTCGAAPAPLCGNCAATAMPIDASYGSVALGVAAAQMAMAALLHLLAGAAGEARPTVTVFDVAGGSWRDGLGAKCIACAGERN